MNSSENSPRESDQTKNFLETANASQPPTEGEEKPSPAPEAPKKRSAKQRRKAEQRRQLITMLSILGLVVLIVGAVLGFNWWQKNKGATAPEDQRVVAVVGEEEVEIPPYSACEIDDPDCPMGEPFELDFNGEEEVTLLIPEDVHDHDWAMLSIYEDPGANTESYHKANETTEVKITPESEKKNADGEHPKLTVVEIHSLMVGRDAENEETPVAAVWAIAPKQ